MNSVIALCLAVLMLAPTAASFAQAGAPRKPAGGAARATQPKPARAPGRAEVLAIAAEYVKTVTPTLSVEEKAAVDTASFVVEGQETTPMIRAQTLDDLVNQSTVALSRTIGIEAVIVTSAHMVEIVPDNVRVVNLFGAVLHTIRKNAEAITVFEYALSLAPKNELVMLNAANTYLDLDRDEKAKTLVDRVIAQNPKNQKAYNALAAYWFKKRDFGKVLDAMARGAALGGWRIKKTAQKNSQRVDENEVTAEDSAESAEKKLNAIKDIVPKTTADVIEDTFPDVAKQIRDRYGKLLDAEKMIMPPLPQVNTSGVKNWKTKGAPYIKEWRKAFEANAKRATYEIANLQAGIKPGDSQRAMKQKAAAAAKQEVQKAFGNAEQALEMMKAAGMPEGKIAEARKRLEAAEAKAKKRKGIEAPEGAAASPEPETITSDADAEKIGAGDVPPGWDYGSMFAVTNYRDYSRIENGYKLYFTWYFRDYTLKLVDVVKVYGQKLQEEKDLHAENIKRIDDRAKAAAAAAAGNPIDTKAFEFERRREDLRYKKAVNALGDDYFAQWANLALPGYTQRLKPMLDQFWAVCGLYIRNMNRPEVMKAEYANVKSAFWTWARMAVSGMDPGNQFVYLGETDEEERELEADIARAREDAEAKAESYGKETKTAETALEKWINDTFAIAVKCEFLSLRISPRGLEIEEYLAGMNFKHVYDFKSGDWTTYRSFAAKVDIGIEVGPINLGVKARVDFLESWDTVNVRNGKFTEGGSRFMTAGGELETAVGPVKPAGSVQVALDPAAESEWSLKLDTTLKVEKEWSDEGKKDELKQDELKQDAS